MLATSRCFQDFWTLETFRGFLLLNLSKNSFKPLHLYLKMATYVVQSFWHHELEFPARSHNRLQDVLPILTMLDFFPTRPDSATEMTISCPLQESDGGG